MAIHADVPVSPGGPWVERFRFGAHRGRGEVPAMLSDVPLAMLRSGDEEGSSRVGGSWERDVVVSGNGRDILVGAPEAIISALSDLAANSSGETYVFKKPRQVGTQFARIESSLIVVLLPYNFSL